MDQENIELEVASESSDNSVSLDIALDDQPKEVPFKGLVSDRVDVHPLARIKDKDIEHGYSQLP